MLVLAWLVISALYLFHLIVLLIPVFNCSKNLLSSSVDKVTTSTYNFISFIWNIHFYELLTSGNWGFSSVSHNYQTSCVITQFSNPVHVKDTSQLINGIFNVLQRLLKFFNGTTILIPFFLFSPVFNSHVIFVLWLNDFESAEEVAIFSFPLPTAPSFVSSL